MSREREIESIGARLRRVRTERGLSQRDVEVPGVSYSYVSRIEAGTRQPSVKALRHLADKLGVSAEYLETGRELRPENEWDLRLGEAELAVRLDDPAAAERRLEGLLAEAEALDERAPADRARVALALAVAEQGRHEDAVELLERALEGGWPPVSERPDLYSILGRSYAEIGETPRAVALFRRCLDGIAAAKQPDPVLHVRFASYLSYALMDVGDTAAAHDVLAEALSQAQGVEDRTTLVRLYWSLGRFYWSEGPVARALDYFRRAIALLEVTEDTFYLARAHEACATILLDQSSVDQAREHLEIAEELFVRLSEPAELGTVRAEWARLSLRVGQPDVARTEALEALERLERASPAELGRTWRALAHVFEDLGEPELAERSYRSGTKALIDHGAPRELAETYRSWGKFLRGQGREREALDAFERAADLGGQEIARAGHEARERAKADPVQPAGGLEPI
jgi:tetratricopeptide (TPR) repeat protein